MIQHPLFVRLTHLNGIPCWVNLHGINSLNRPTLNGREDTTFLYTTTSDNGIEVKETPAEIFALMKAEAAAWSDFILDRVIDTIEKKRAEIERAEAARGR